MLANNYKGRSGSRILGVKYIRSCGRGPDHRLCLNRSIYGCCPQELSPPTTNLSRDFVRPVLQYVLSSLSFLQSREELWSIIMMSEVNNVWPLTVVWMSFHRLHCFENFISKFWFPSTVYIQSRESLLCGSLCRPTQRHTEKFGWWNWRGRQTKTTKWDPKNRRMLQRTNSKDNAVYFTHSDDTSTHQSSSCSIIAESLLFFLKEICIEIYTTTKYEYYVGSIMEERFTQSTKTGLWNRRNKNSKPWTTLQTLSPDVWPSASYGEVARCHQSETQEVRVENYIGLIALLVYYCTAKKKSEGEQKAAPAHLVRNPLCTIYVTTTTCTGLFLRNLWETGRMVLPEIHLWRRCARSKSRSDW